MAMRPLAIALSAAFYTGRFLARVPSRPYGQAVSARVLVCLAALFALWGVGLLGGCKRDDQVSRDLGASCDGDGDCSARCLPKPRWPGGFCTRDCNQDSDCPAGASCLGSSDGQVCLYLCLDDRDCSFLVSTVSVGWSCRPAGAKLVCAPAAVLDAVDAGGGD